MTKYKLVVFDLDGTLVNSLTDLAIATNKGLEKAGLPIHETEAYKKFVGNGRDKLIDRAMGEAHRDAATRKIVMDEFDGYYNRHLNDNTVAYDGCAEMLREIGKMGVKTGVLSNKPDEFVAKILEKCYPDYSFDAAWGKRADFSPKPDPASLNAMLSELNVSLEECLYIGDSDVDVFTAANAGVDMIGVEWGFRGREELVSAGAPFVASKAEEITEYVV